MAAPADFPAVFEQLRKILKKHEADLVVQTNTPDHYYLNTPLTREDGYRIAFGGVQIKKNYVSFHLMPVYGNPKLLNDISAELKKRMQGKSCFNFKKVDTALFEELDRLTEKGFQAYKKGCLNPHST